MDDTASGYLDVELVEVEGDEVVEFLLLVLAQVFRRGRRPCLMIGDLRDESTG